VLILRGKEETKMWDWQRYQMIRSGKLRLAGMNGEFMQQPDSLDAYLGTLEQAQRNRERVYLVQNDLTLTDREVCATIGTSGEIVQSLGGLLGVRVC
jgi:hypothetical protein